MTELDFLLELFLDDELPKTTRKRIADRIKDVQQTIQATPQRAQRPVQAPSTQRILDNVANSVDSVDMEALVASPAAAQALQRRNEAIASAGKDTSGRTSARKF